MLLNYRHVYERGTATREERGRDRGTDSAAGGCPNTPAITRLDCTLILRRATHPDVARGGSSGADNGERDLSLPIFLSLGKEAGRLATAIAPLDGKILEECQFSIVSPRSLPMSVTSASGMNVARNYTY